MRRALCLLGLLLLGGCSLNIRLVFQPQIDHRRLEEKLDSFEREVRSAEPR